MANSGVAKLACLLLITLMVAAAPHAEAAITCANVLTTVSPCLGYLRAGGAPPVACCGGVKSLFNAARARPDLQAVCSCIKSLAPSVGAKAENINSIPAKCGVNIPYRYSPNLDCTKL